jgi:sugar phosphate isomerase/epimerase
MNAARLPIVACHYWSFYDLDLEAACRHAAVLGYNGLDLGSGDLGTGARLDLTQIAVDDSFPARARRAAEDAGIVYTDLFAVLPSPVTEPDDERVRTTIRLFRSLAPSLAAAGIPGVTLSPGATDERGWEPAVARAAATLRELVAIGRDAGLLVGVEPHLESIADTPARTLALLDAVPGLTLTLDYSHFMAAGYAQEAVEPLHPFARHVHVRQSRPGHLAVAVNEGTLDMTRIVTLLLREGYEGAITVEYVSSPWQGQDQVDAAKENAAMRAEIRAIIAAWQESEAAR